MSQRKKKQYESVLISNIDGKQFKTHHQFVYHLKQLGITQQEYYDEYLKRSNLEGTCATCKDPTGFINIIYGYKLYCSHNCAVNNIDVSKRRNENTISALIKKYGVINAGQMSTHRKKMEKTCLERYGNAHYVNPEKGKETHIKRYGKHYTGTPEYKKQYDITVKQKYGVVHHTQSDVVKNKIKSTCMKRYGANSYLKIRKDTKQSVLPKMKRFYTYIMEYCKVQNLTVLDLTEKSFIKNSLNRRFHILCNVCNKKFIYNWKSTHNKPICTICNKPHYISKWENEVRQYIISLLGEDAVKSNIRNYEGSVLQELDIYLPDYQLGIECNGVYWHSEYVGHKTPKYHIHKTDFYNTLGIKLIHIWDYEWNTKRDIVKSRISSILKKNTNKIGARKLITTRITAKQAKEFLNQNHLQGFSPATYHIGLMSSDKILYAVMSISIRGRVGISGKNQAELMRFSTKLYWTVSGAFSKLFKYCFNVVDAELRNKKIISYADRRWSDKVIAYESTGFKLMRISMPSYWYIKSGKMYHRSLFMKHLLPTKLKLVNMALTEMENMNINGYDRVWDCGELVYEYTSK